MREKSNISDISTSLPLKFEKLKTKLRKEHDLVWTDFLVLCALIELQKVNYFIQTADLVSYIGKNRCWVYNSVRKLKEKELIGVGDQSKFTEPREIWINGLGQFLVKTMFRGIWNNESK